MKNHNQNGRYKTVPYINIAIIDDSQEYLDFLSSSLRRLDKEVQVCAFTTIEDAKAQFLNITPDFVICDINFDPEDETDCRGLDLLSWLKKNYPKIPVVMMTRYLDQGFKSKAVALGTDEFLEKPIKIQQLKGLLEKFPGKS